MARNFGGVSPVRHSDRTKLLALVAVIFLLGCVALVVALLSPGSSPSAAPAAVVTERAPDIQMVSVLVPTREIESGTPLEPSMFRQETRPQVGVDSRVIRDFEEIKGQFARSIIVSGQPLHRDYITSVRPINSVTASIPEGYRAVTIKVDARTSVEGFTRPGAKVDVNWIANIKGRPTVTVIVQNAKVLSAERQTDTDAQKAGTPVPNTVTLLVTAEDAAKIQLASTEGTLSLSLRGDNDPGQASATDRITMDTMLSKDGDSKAVNDNSLGTLTIGGQKYLVKPGGKMVPVTQDK